MTRFVKLSAATLLLGGIAAGGLAIAQDAPPPVPGDGPLGTVVDAPDAGPMGDRMDGRMEGPMEGMMRGHGPMGGLDFAAIDIDKDGRVTQAELVTRATARLSAADANKDGVLDRAELIAAMPGPRESILMVFAPDPSADFADRLLARMGATDAGRVEIAALAQMRANALLERIDDDEDGAISQEEAREARGHGRKGRHGDHDGPRHSRG